MKICPNCKVEYGDLENFCIRCGKRLERESVTLEALAGRLKVMEGSLSGMSRGVPAAGPAVAAAPGLERRLEDVKTALMEKINHTADVTERLAERLKEIDGMSAGDREEAKAAARRMISDELKNVGQDVILDLRKDIQNISGRGEALAAEVKGLRGDIESLRSEVAAVESRVAKRIYKELTKSLIT